MDFLSKEYIKREDQTLRIEVYYDLGGYNWATGNEEPRGYYLSVTPVSVVRNDEGKIIMEEVRAFSGIKTVLMEVERKSKNRSKKALEIVENGEDKERLINDVLEKVKQNI